MITRSRSTVRWLVAALVVATVLAGAAVVVHRLQAGHRAPLDALLVPPSTIDLLSGEQWQEDSARAVGGELTRQWINARSRDRFVQSIIEHSGGITARYGYSAEDPRINDREDFGPEGVRETPLGVPVSADQSLIYCLVTGRQNEPCSLWVYWSRYGLYTVKIYYREPGLDAARFAEIVKIVDARISAVLD